MNSAHLHLFLTHAPVFGTLFGLLLLLLARLKKSDEIKRLSLLVFIIAGLLVIPTYVTGEPAEKLLKDRFPTMSLESAEQHEEIAVLALVSVLFVGLLALAGTLLFGKGKTIPSWFMNLILILALISSAALTWTANLGGKVRHTEIRTESPTAHRDH